MSYFWSLSLLLLFVASLFCLLRRRTQSRRRRHRGFADSNTNLDAIDLENLFNVAKINFRGVKRSLKDTINFRSTPKEEILNPMPSFMYEATDQEIINNQELPNEIRLALRRLRIFLSESPQVALKILKEAETIHYDDEEIIFDTNDSVKHLFIVIYGQVTIKAKLMDSAETSAIFTTGDSIFNFMNILQGMFFPENPANVKAIATQECALIKIPIDFFTQNGTKLKFIETAITWTERFIYNILIRTLDLTDYISETKFFTPCDCGKCNDIEYQTANATNSLREKLNLSQAILDDVLSKAEIHVYRNMERITNWTDSLFYISHGSVEESVKVESSMNKVINHSNQGSFFGINNIFMYRPRAYQLRSVAINTALIKWNSKDVIRIISKYPQILDILIRSYVSSHSSLYNSLEWLSTPVEFAKDTTIISPLKKSNSIYVIISGRVRTIGMSSSATSSSHRQQPIIIEELGHGDLIGDVGILPLQQTPSSTYSYITVRFTVTICVPYHVINTLQNIFPSSLPVLTKIYQQAACKSLGASSSNPAQSSGPLVNVKTVAVVSGSSGVPLQNFGRELHTRLAYYNKKCMILDNSRILRTFNQTDVNCVSSLKLMSYLSLLESESHCILMICDDVMTKWTRHALEQADVILVVCNFSENIREPRGIERKIIDMQFKTTRQLILLHPSVTKQINGTSEWLKTRSGYHMHLHIRCSETFFQTNHKINMDVTDHFSRLARFLSGKAIGLACGAGGARGYAHVGILQEFHSKKIPIDMISGSSMGAFIGGIYSMTECPNEVDEKVLIWVKHTSSKLFWFLDLTLPFTSLLAGRQFFYVMNQIFGKTNIEDFWIPFLPVTTDLTSESKSTHSTGPAAIYIQASMCLIGYLPPVSDPQNDHLLVDGGYTDMVPASDLLHAGCSLVYGSVVSTSSVGLYKGNYGPHLSGIFALLYRCLPFHLNNVPSYFDLHFHLSFICSSAAMKYLEDSCGHDQRIKLLYPDVTKYKNIDFHLYDKISDLGNESAKKYIDSIKCIECLTGAVNCTNCLNISLDESRN